MKGNGNKIQEKIKCVLRRSKTRTCTDTGTRGFTAVLFTVAQVTVDRCPVEQNMVGYTQYHITQS